MNTTAVRCSSLALAFCLGGASGTVLAKGSGTKALQNPALTHYTCESTSASTTTTHKSPQRTSSYACEPKGPRVASLPAGNTAAKTPSRVVTSVP